MDEHLAVAGNGEKAATRQTRGKWARWVVIGAGVILAGLLLGACDETAANFAAELARQSLETAEARAVTATPSSEPVFNRIAFVGNDDNIWLVSPDGGELSALTTEGNRYSQPVWSPDGRFVAYIGAAGRTSALYLSPAATEETPTVLFEKRGSTPFYLYWAPDSQSVTFLTQESDGLAMRQADVASGQDRVLGEGSPFYWVWAPAGDRLLMHVGGARARSPQAHLSILHHEQEAERIELKLAPGRFQAPLWSPDGQHVFYIATDGDGDEGIYKMHADTLEAERLVRLSGFAYMVLSPAGDQIAYLEIGRNDRAPFGAAYVMNTDGSNKRQVTEELVGSMYWSPDGSKLALLTPARRREGPTARIDGLASPLPQQELVLRWWIYDVEAEALEPLFTFDPTFHFLQTVPYFDQYHLSLTFWSPDSRYFVAAEEEEEGRDGAVWVLDTTGQEAPRRVAEGTLAVWSWQ